MISIQDRPIPLHSVKVSNDDEHVLEVDVENAWEEMMLQSGWVDEVEVKINVGA